MRNRKSIENSRIWKIASVSLAIWSLVPVPVFFLLMGLWIDSSPIEPSLILVLLFLPVVGLAIPALMYAGSAAWLIVAPYWVPREIAETFFVVDGLGWFSDVSRRLYLMAYGSRSTSQS
ncbi:MAG: hypothetical protein EA364_09715 [Balneolaceae bacterium]|jgi:hypothetical protein|nr:MAG: hypothetical protein EA364_09715 [Balneolaceae bacterium]